MDVYKIRTYIHSPHRVNEWLFYVASYCRASQCLAHELKGLENDPRIDGRSRNEIVVPLLFNLRHSIELLLKLLASVMHESPRKIHDITALFIKFKVAVDSLDKKDLPKVAQDFRISADRVEGTLEGSIVRLEQIANKYCNNKFHTDKGDVVIEDMNNELFRYPVDFDKEFKLDFDHWNLEIPTDEILNDVEFLGSASAWLAIIISSIINGGAKVHWGEKRNREF